MLISYTLSLYESIKMSTTFITFLLTHIKTSEVKAMPSTMPGRELVKQFLQQNGI